MNFKYLSTILITAILLLAIFIFGGWKAENKEFSQAKTDIVIRKIGHEVLLLSGDSTSRVLPVKQLASNEYQLQFESDFSFVPDSLIKNIQQIIGANNLGPDYIVNVVQCANNEVIFGYAVLGSEEKSIEPCVGRDQAKGCYFINLTFNKSNSGLQAKYVAIVLMLLAALIIFPGAGKYFRHRKDAALPQEPTEEEPVTAPVDKHIPIGQFLFNNDEQYLLINEEKTVLTIKECKLLLIFANAPNQIIQRSRLQKEVWEDEGVIVGRSLDMFISKLRKKLEKDPAVQLINIHGKGYKLEIGS